MRLKLAMVVPFSQSCSDIDLPVWQRSKLCGLYYLVFSLFIFGLPETHSTVFRTPQETQDLVLPFDFRSLKLE